EKRIVVGLAELAELLLFLLRVTPELALVRLGPERLALVAHGGDVRGSAPGEERHGKKARQKFWWPPPPIVRCAPGGTSHASSPRAVAVPGDPDGLCVQSAAGPAQRVRRYSRAQGSHRGPQQVHHHRVPRGQGCPPILQGARRD